MELASGEEERAMFERYDRLRTEIQDLKALFLKESQPYTFQTHVPPTLPKRFVPPLPQQQPHVQEHLFRPQPPAAAAVNFFTPQPLPPQQPVIHLTPKQQQPIYQNRSPRPATPVFNRLLKKGEESQAKLGKLREQLQEQSARPFAGNIPKINDTSRRIVENRRNSFQTIDVMATMQNTTPCSSFTTSVTGEEISSGMVWKEHATSEVSFVHFRFDRQLTIIQGYLYYYNLSTKETTWEKPNAAYIPLKPTTTAAAFSLDQAKRILST